MTSQKKLKLRMKSLKEYVIKKSTIPIDNSIEIKIAEVKNTIFNCEKDLNNSSFKDNPNILRKLEFAKIQLNNLEKQKK